MALEPRPLEGQDRKGLVSFFKPVLVHLQSALSQPPHSENVSL